MLAIELLMACQALDLLLPLTSTPPLQAVHDLVRQSIPYVIQFLLLRIIANDFLSIEVLGIKIDLWLMILKNRLVLLDLVLYVSISIESNRSKIFPFRFGKQHYPTFKIISIGIIFNITQN